MKIQKNKDAEKVLQKYVGRNKPVDHIWYSIISACKSSKTPVMTDMTSVLDDYNINMTMVDELSLWKQVLREI